jgi:3'-phosphoadenosine 5'-phosphosulfate sulfotransferase (PAPS reductase)/FAD synthetase
MDSVAMAHRMIEQEWSDDYGAWNKRPVVIFCDTTIGLSSQRLYVQLLADYYGWQLWTLRTHENFDEHSEEEGFYGNDAHNKIFNRLKGRQYDKLATSSGNPHLYFGSRIEEKGDHVERVQWREEYSAYTHNPILHWSDEDVRDYLREHEVPYNPNWEANHFTDCGCGATASREELIEIEAEGYEIFAEKLREIEERVETGDKTETWAWGSFEPDEQQWLDADADDEQTTLCDVACGGNGCTEASINPDSFRADGGRNSRPQDTGTDHRDGGEW